MTEFSNKTLAQIVTDNHRTASVFEKYHLDFCCKGKRSLEAACKEQQISSDELINELTLASTAKQDAFPFDKLTLQQLVEYIVDTHHAYVKKESPQLLAYLQKVASKHGERHPELYRIFETFSAVKEEMELHMQKEELVLFPRIKDMEQKLPEGSSGLKLNINYLLAPINMMEEEHDHAGNLLREIRELTNEYTPPQDACTTYKLAFASLKAFEYDLHQHVHLENNILFPKTLKLFRSALN
jgi:regulator of cell morphogenesis and NO signaling